MLKAGHFDDEHQARVFGDYLFVQGIENQVDCNRDGVWELWVLDHGQLSAARSQLEDYLKDPKNPKYGSSSTQADKKKRGKQKEQEAHRRQRYDAKRLFGSGRFRLQSLTFLLIVLSVIITLASHMGRKRQKRKYKGI